MWTQEVLTWGDRLVVATFHNDRGLRPTVDVLRGLLGPSIGTRQTFAKLLRVETVDELRDVDRYRAWLLLTAYGENPAAWGIGRDVVPPMLDADDLKARIVCAAADSNREPAVTEDAQVIDLFTREMWSTPFITEWELAS